MNSRKLIVAFGIFAMIYMLAELAGCTHKDDITDILPVPSLELIAKKISTPPVIDGQIDGIWEQAQRVTVIAEVPDPGNLVFNGFVGNSYMVSLRAAYDNDNIYFLAEWNDLSKSLNRQPWYFDPANQKWKQESGAPTFDQFGSMTRKPFYEDKFGMLFNINNSVKDWKTLTCYASCHTSLSSAAGLARHYTNGPNERIDMWHWKAVRTAINEQFDDQYQDDTFPNGRKSDASVSGGYSNNVKTLNNGVEDVSVPKYFIPGQKNYYWITQSEIDAGIAKEITAVDVSGVLTYAGGTIDPNADTEFQRAGATTGSKCIPSIYTSPFVGSRGDISAVGSHTGTGWILEFKRPLNTGDPNAVDVDFSSLQDQAFGVAIFDNAQIAHAIKTGITLKFE